MKASQRAASGLFVSKPPPRVPDDTLESFGRYKVQHEGYRIKQLAPGTAEDLEKLKIRLRIQENKILREGGE